MRTGLALMMALVMLLGLVWGIDWQAVGDMTSPDGDIDYQTHIIDYFTSNFVSATRGSTAVAFSTAVSDNLNTRYKPAWNVLMTDIGDGTNSDTIVNGYAFRKHWFWSNGHKSAGNLYWSILVWKDYNCNPSDWTNVDTYDGERSNLPSQTLTDFNSWRNQYFDTALSRYYVSFAKTSGIWQASMNLIDSIKADSNLG